MILLIRNNEGFEPRVKKYIAYFKKHNLPYKFIGWNRNGSAKYDSDSVFFERRSIYGRRIKNIPVKLMWMFFVIKEIYKVRREVELVHACDIDAVIPAFGISKLLGKKIIFDIFDWISSLDGKGMVYNIIERLQNFCYKYSDYIILCEEERRNQAKVSNPYAYTLPNIPHDERLMNQDTFDSITLERQKHQTTISYVGVFDRDRGLENLLERVSKEPGCLLNIAGFGVLGELVEKYAIEHEQIVYWGRVEYEVGQAIMKNSDYICAMYYLTSPLHKYAAPNKFYESLMLGVPIITTQDTLVGNKTLEHGTGLVISEEPNSLVPIVSGDISGGTYCNLTKSCNELWVNKYRDYSNNFFSTVYLAVFLENKYEG